MASTGKKGKKSGKGKTLSLNDFLAPEASNIDDAATTVIVPKTSWADEFDDESDSRPMRSEKIVLPTAPRASLGPNVSEDRIPREPPFTAYIANLSYDINPEDVYKFFDKLKIINVRLLRDGDPETGRLKGFGYADFGDRDSLVEALSMNDHLLKNRKIRIDISTNAGGRDGDRDRGGRYGNRNNDRQPRYNNDDDGDDRTAGDWRSGPAPAFRDDDRPPRGGSDRYEPPRDRFDNRSGYGRQQYDDRRSYNNDRDDRRDNRGYGFGRERRDGDRGGFDRYERRDNNYDRRGGGGGYSDRGGYDRRDAGGYDRRDGGSSFDRRGGGDRYERRSNDRDEREAPRERPKLQLAKRSAPIEASSEPVSSSIFGGAKPVDTARKEREIDEKLQREKVNAPEKARSRTTSEANDEQPKASIFGQAKPVDTAKKDREIEEKLKTLDVVDEQPIIHAEKKKQPPRSTTPPLKKMEEAKPPNFAGSNKYAFLNDEDVGSGKEDSD